MNVGDRRRHDGRRGGDDGADGGTLGPVHVRQGGAEEAGHEILELCVASGGCLTGEHGVGIEKRDLMRVQFTETDLLMQMRIKTVFDPKWLLNPAKVFPLEGRKAAQEAA